MVNNDLKMKLKYLKIFLVISTLTCLFCGVLSIVIFILIHREQAWDWIKTFEEPLECMLIIYPAISYILLPFILVYELKKANINETDF